MISPFHMAFGLLLYLILAQLGIIPFSMAFLLLAVTISACLDVDHLIIYYHRKANGEKLPKLLKFLTTGKSRSVQTHSILIALVVFVILFFFNKNIAIVYIAAHLGHIGLDLLDKEGTPAFWPFKNKNYTGPLKFISLQSFLLFGLIIIADIILLLYRFI